MYLLRLLKSDRSFNRTKLLIFKSAKTVLMSCSSETLLPQGVVESKPNPSNPKAKSKFIAQMTAAVATSSAGSGLAYQTQ